LYCFGKILAADLAGVYPFRPADMLALDMRHEIVGPLFERRDGRGIFRELLNGFPAGTIVCGRMKSGAVMGNHYHRRTRVFFHLLGGAADVRTVNVESGAKEEFVLGENQGVYFEPLESHAVEFREDSEFLMVKSLPYDAQDPDTIEYPVPK
jgi:dTDP-4-dehydrorhamnose 3,5-epimerase-like enzyme